MVAESYPVDHPEGFGGQQPAPPIGYRPYRKPPKSIFHKKEPGPRAGDPYRVLRMIDYQLPGGSIPATPMPPYRDTLLPFNFLIPHDTDENSPMPRFQLEPGETGILVIASCRPRFILQLLTRPEIMLDGPTVPQNTRWGSNLILAAPGLHHLRVCPPPWKAPWQGQFGSDPSPADAIVPVVAGQVTRVYSRASVASGVHGAIGPVPQRLPGIVSFCITWAIFGGLALTAIVLGAYTSFH